MSPTRPSLNHWLALIHRWAALLIALPLLLILLSGAVLAFKPILGSDAPTVSPVSTGQIAAALAGVDPADKAASLQVDGGADRLILKDGPNAVSHPLSGGGAASPVPADIFDVALRLHRNLLIGAGFVVESATWIMAGLLLSGLFLGLPRRLAGLLGWHKGLGWFAFPLLALTPITGVLMILHIGGATLPRPEPGPAVSLQQALTVAQQEGLEGITSVRRFRGGSAFITLANADGSRRVLVTPSQRIVPVGGPGLVRELHEGTWSGALSGVINLIAVIGLGALLVTGLWSWARRWRQSRARLGSGRLLIAHASQTGTAAALAERTATLLQAAGASITCTSLARLAPADLAAYDEALLIVSTTGEGALPQPAQSFYATLGQQSLQSFRFSLLALGDRRYTRFCGGGAALREALLARGARESSPWQQADRDPTPMWRTWLQDQCRRLGISPSWLDEDTSAAALALRLHRRTRLDKPEKGASRETWQLLFQGDKLPAFRPGDLLLLTPPGAQRPRSYSIGSSSLAGANLIELTVSLHTWQDAQGNEQLGSASRWLCHELREGTLIQAGFRANKAFHPPASHQHPLILVAAGSGIAPFPGFLAERCMQADAGPIWLFFGNRQRQADFLYKERWRSWQDAGALTRLDTAFSRDTEPMHVQDALLAQGERVIEWLVHRQGMLYTCGRAGTLVDGVEETLCRLLQQYAADPEPRATLARWKAEGRLRMDVFD